MGSSLHGTHAQFRFGEIIWAFLNLRVPFWGVSLLCEGYSILRSILASLYLGNAANTSPGQKFDTRRCMIRVTGLHLPRGDLESRKSILRGQRGGVINFRE